MEYFKYKNEKGVAALLLVMIISVAALLMAVGAARLGMGELESGDVSQKADETYYIGDSCVAEALERLRVNPNYTGGTLSLGSGSCILTVVASGSVKTITANATVGQYNKKIQISATLGAAGITINSWSEITL
jgi:hypothetical protein